MTPDPLEHIGSFDETLEPEPERKRAPRGQVKMSCARCGAVVWKFPSYIARSKSGRVFCSPRCSNICRGKNDAAV